MRRSPLARYALLGLAALWLATPLSAYMVYLKDGSKIQAREKYVVDGSRAILTLFNGTKTFIPMSQIDVKKSDEANSTDYGRAEVLPGSAQDIELEEETGPRQRTLRDMVRNKETAVRDIPASRRADNKASAGVATKLAGGAYDLMTWSRKPFTDMEVAGELRRLLAIQGVEEIEIYEGTKSDRPFLEITTNSEGSVFKTLAGAAATLPLLRQVHSKVGALELLLITTDRDRAGQFTISPEMAQDLASKKVDLVSFYLRNVQF
jgi:hypothetical protein